MPGKNFHIDCGLANNFRNAFRRVVKLKVDGLSLWIVDFNLLGRFPPLTGLTPHQLVEFVDGSAHAYFEGQHFFLLRGLFEQYSPLSNHQDVFHY